VSETAPVARELALGGADRRLAVLATRLDIDLAG
jgi:hypothetical protein